VLVREVKTLAGVILVRDVMETDVKTVRPDSSVMEAIQKMNKFDVGSIVVVQERRPVGIITERDILRKILESGLDPVTVKARQIMSSPIITIREDSAIEEAAKIMTTKRIKKIPVVKDGKLIGIVTATDLVRSEPKMISLLEDLIWSKSTR
jgi:CBS domain-containing protein